MDNRRVPLKTGTTPSATCPDFPGDFYVERDEADSPMVRPRESLNAPRRVRGRRTLRLLLVGFAVVLTLESVGQAQVRLSDESIRQILQDRVVREKKGVAIVAGLLDDAGERVIALGPPVKGSDLTVGGDSLFEIGSITKTFVTTLLADMVERGEVGLNDPIVKYLPPSVRAPTRNGKEITILHLATHTSGLPRNADNLAPFWWRVLPLLHRRDSYCRQLFDGEDVRLPVRAHAPAGHRIAK
jgi:CubicO group peptidase (beta-lactamase class C family)